jgi:hypothetical protein
MEKKLEEAEYIVWVNHGYDGWSCTGLDSLDEAVRYETYGSEKVITRGIINWKAVEKCPYPDCPKVLYKECPVHGVITTNENN